MRKLALVCITAFAINGCSLFGLGDGASMSSGGSSEAKAAIKSAEAAIKKSKSVGGEWRDAKKKFIKKAKSAEVKGDFKKAIKLANKAKFQGEMGEKQAMEEMHAKPWLF